MFVMCHLRTLEGQIDCSHFSPNYKTSSDLRMTITEENKKKNGKKELNKFMLDKLGQEKLKENHIVKKVNL